LSLASDINQFYDQPFLTNIDLPAGSEPSSYRQQGIENPGVDAVDRSNDDNNSLGELHGLPLELGKEGRLVRTADNR
jgi:hypothetical protein